MARSILTVSMTVRRYWYIFHKVTGPPSGAPPSRDFTCRLVTLADLPTLDVFGPYRSLASLRAWLSEPQTWVVVAFDGTRPVAYACVSRQLPSNPPFSRLRLDANDVWVRDEYTIPEYRRQRVMRSLRGYRNQVLRELGVAGTVSAVAEDNLASLVSTYDANVRKVEGLEYRRILVLRSVRRDADVRARLEALLAARPAHRRPALVG
jgi:hypothetical protein